LTYLLAGLGANLVTCLAAVVFKLLPPVQPHVMNGVGMVSGALILLGLSFASGERVALPSNLYTWAAFLYLVVFGSVCLFALFLFVLKRLTASAVAYQTVLSPIVTIILAAWLLAESVSGRLIIGSLIVFSGVYIGSLSPAAQTGPENKKAEAPAQKNLKAPCHPC
jgi:drug/metabolite transporter (DMT)-like permease